MTQKLLTTGLLVLVCMSACNALLQQSVGCKGRLMCGNRPATGVKVKLWDEDDGKFNFYWKSGTLTLCYPKKFIKNWTA